MKSLPHLPLLAFLFCAPALAANRLEATRESARSAQVELSGLRAQQTELRETLNAVANRVSRIASSAVSGTSTSSECWHVEANR